MFNLTLILIFGDLLVISSVVCNNRFDASFPLELLDFCGVMIFQTFFLHLLVHRQTSLYKRIAIRFYNYVYHLLLLKAMISPVIGFISLVISSIFNYSITTIIILFQIVLVLAQMGMNFSLKYKFESLYLIQSQGNNSRTQLKSALSLDTNSNSNSYKVRKKSMKELYEETKLDIYENIKRDIIGMSTYVIISIILLIIFHKDSPYAQYYLSLSYRSVSIIPMMLSSKPIIKSCMEKRKAAYANPSNEMEAEEINIDVQL